MLSKFLLVLAVAACLLQYGASMEVDGAVKPGGPLPQFLNFEKWTSLNDANHCTQMDVYVARAHTAATNYGSLDAFLTVATASGNKALTVWPSMANLPVWILPMYCGGENVQAQWALSTQLFISPEGPVYFAKNQCPEGYRVSMDMKCDKTHRFYYGTYSKKIPYQAISIVDYKALEYYYQLGNTTVGGKPSGTCTYEFNSCM